MSSIIGKNTFIFHSILTVYNSSFSSENKIMHHALCPLCSRCRWCSRKNHYCHYLTTFLSKTKIWLNQTFIFNRLRVRVLICFYFIFPQQFTGSSFFFSDSILLTCTECFTFIARLVSLKGVCVLSFALTSFFSTCWFFLFCFCRLIRTFSGFSRSFCFHLVICFHLFCVMLKPKVLLLSFLCLYISADHFTSSINQTIMLSTICSKHATTTWFADKVPEFSSALWLIKVTDETENHLGASVLALATEWSRWDGRKCRELWRG